MEPNVDLTVQGLERWCSVEGKTFINKEAEEAYRKRARRIADCIMLKEPDRVPIHPSFGFFPYAYSGFTCEDGMFDSEKSIKAFKKAILDFQPDLCSSPAPANGRVFEILGYNPIQLPGRGIPANVGFQFVEAEYIKAEDFYDHFLDDPSDFMIRKFFPRICDNLQPLKNMRPLHECFSYAIGFGPNLGQLGRPEILEVIEKLKEVGEISARLGKAGADFENFLISNGFPSSAGGGTAAPYDVIGDFIRGTKGVMLDMYRRPEKLLKAMDKLVPYLIDLGSKAKDRGAVFVGMPLHKHADGFMSLQQFKTFFWPSLRKVLMGLIDQGLIPMPFFEGEVTSRLEVIKDIPKGKAIYQFQNVDLRKAKDILGDTVCFKGNIPASLLCTGTTDQVKASLKELIDVVGKGGGLIINSGSVMDGAKPENVKALFDFTREYGVYKK
jgi:hypothetical protein